MSFLKHTCKLCGGRMILLTSINKLMCSDCKHMTDWRLKKNQTSVLIEGLKGDG